MRTLRTVALAAASGVGLLFSLLSLTVTAMALEIGLGVPWLRLLLMFGGSFALSFGVAAACTVPWFSGHGPLAAGGAFAAGGAIGGAVQAGTLIALDRFEPQLRALTGGGPLSMFLLAGGAAALVTPVVLGRLLLRRIAHRGAALAR